MNPLAGFTIKVQSSAHASLWRTIHGRWLISRPRETFDKRDRTVTVHDGKKLVASFVYDVRLPSCPRLNVYSVFVEKRYRKCGIASALWRIVIALEQPIRIFVSAISDGGKTMIDGVRYRCPDIDWHVTEDGNRKLRRLGKAKAPSSVMR